MHNWLWLQHIDWRHFLPVKAPQYLLGDIQIQSYTLRSGGGGGGGVDFCMKSVRKRVCVCGAVSCTYLI